MSVFCVGVQGIQKLAALASFNICTVLFGANPLGTHTHTAETLHASIMGLDRIKASLLFADRVQSIFGFFLSSY